MDTLRQFFTDPQLFYDSERQCRALEMAITIREAEPLYYIECRPFSQLLDAIDRNVLERFSLSELSSFKHNKRDQRVLSAGIRTAEEHNPVMAGIFGCFEEYLDEARNALLQDGADAGSIKDLVVLKQLDAKSTRTQEELQRDLCMLVAPLCRFLYVTLSKGIYLTTSTDEFRDVHAVEVLFQSIARLFLHTLPHLLFNFGTDVEDPAQFSFNNESVCLMMKAALEMLASLMALINYHNKYGPILLVPDARQDVIDAQNSLEHILPTKTDYSQVVKLSSLDHLLFSIGKGVMPILGEYLMQCNKFLSALYTVTNPHRTRLSQLNAALSSISIGILFFIHELLSMTYVDSSCLVYEQPSVPVDDTVGTLRNKSFRKIRNSSNPRDNEFLTRRAISKNLPNKTAVASFKTREEVHECIISTMVVNKMIDQIFVFLQASEGSRPYLLALSILHILPLDRMSSTHYACTVLARLCVDKFHHYFVVKGHDFAYKRLNRKEIDLQLSYLHLIAKASTLKSSFISVLCEFIRLTPEKESVNKPRKTSTMDKDAEPEQLVFNFVSDYVIELLSRYGRHEFHPVRHALVYLNGPAQLEAIMQAGMTIAKETLVFERPPIYNDATMTGLSFNKNLVKEENTKNTSAAGRSIGSGRSSALFRHQATHPVSGSTGGRDSGLNLFNSSARNVPLSNTLHKNSLPESDRVAGTTVSIIKSCAGTASTAIPKSSVKPIIDSKVMKALTEEYIHVSKTAKTSGTATNTGRRQLEYHRPAKNFRSNVPEGYTVNYIELNKQRLSEGKLVEEDYQRQVKLAAQQDEEEDYYILHSSDIPNHMRTVKMYEALEEREKRNRRMFNACKAKIFTDMRKGMSVIMHNGTYENEHFDECVKIKNKGSLMGKLTAALGGGALDSNMPLVTNALDQIDPVYEVLYIYHSLVILRNLICHSSTMADNKTRSILATIKPDLLKALVYFISTQNPVLLSVSFDLLFEIITYPEGLSEYLQYGINIDLSSQEEANALANMGEKMDYSASVWEILMFSNFVDILRDMISVGQIDAINFIMRFFQQSQIRSFAAAGLAQAATHDDPAPILRLNEKVIKEFAVFIDPLIQFFYMTSDIEMQQIALIAVSFLSFTCGPSTRPLLGSYISNHSLDVLSGTIIDVSRVPNHFNMLAVIVAAYGVFAGSNDSRAAAACVQSNVLSTICETFVSRFTDTKKDSAKLAFVDIILIRFLTDILGSGNAEVLAYLQENTTLQSAICGLYRRWLQTNKMMHVDEDTLVLLPGTERKAAKRNIPRGCFYDLTTDFISAVSMLKRSGSPANVVESLRSGSTRTTATSRGRPVKNYIHQYSNIVAIQSQICDAMGNDESFELLDLFQNKDCEESVSGSRSFTATKTLGTLNEGVLEDNGSGEGCRDTHMKGRYSELLNLNSRFKYKDWFPPILDSPTVERSQLEIPPELTNMMLTDFNSLVLAFFKALYHNLGSLECKIIKYEPKRESLLQSALMQASVRSEAPSLNASLVSTKHTKATVSDLNLSSLGGPTVTLPSLPTPASMTVPESLTGTAKPSLGLCLPIVPKLGSGKMDIALSTKATTPPAAPEVVLHLPTVDVLSIIAMLGYGLKSTLEIYQKTSAVEFIAADREFVTAAATRIEERIMALSEQGAALVREERDAQLGGEAEYYTSMLK
ncbi:hypothetical protein GL50803_0017388 [Giardia duodenalis]|uniref:Uncharacterized protein n=1 Tax=Giardia intestinalis (strain ATCC 50803 / WB clone C6) TaxID=184922 RepID=A8BLV5_GIAIC|nr:hypothetical protein GL50803_0017388 [Giardia intestinalis]KAE8302278.1 hypothetical protein GL50803_0017388 [Giardia intestinalis]|eukprot:XP_001706188.1 Hypothetical protein GL50803_17388 [Giardia lamblia ATCC 50803]